MLSRCASAALCLAFSMSTAWGSAKLDSISLEHWQRDLLPVLGDLSFLDLDLPGTHDSLTFDLSDRIADNANDLPPWLADLLHLIPPTKVGEFIRNQSVTQVSSIEEQLGAGVRFIDFRITYSLGPNATTAKASHIRSTAVDGDAWQWYGLHTLQTRQPALVYLQRIQRWLGAHPGEIVALWFSRHSSACATGTEQYPGTTAAIRQRFWKQVEALFGDMLFNTEHHGLNSTSLGELQRRRIQLIVFASDYSEFTGRSSRAVDACQALDIWDPPTGVVNEPLTQSRIVDLLQDATEHRAHDKISNKFWQMFMSTSTPKTQIETMALATFEPYSHEELYRLCAASFSIPGMTTWCPATLLDIIRLTNFYTQRTIMQALSNAWKFPNTMYLGGILPDGCLATGPRTGPKSLQAFGFTASIILASVQRTCNQTEMSRAIVASESRESHTVNSTCAETIAALVRLRDKCPLATWSDPEHGRVVGWPPFNTGNRTSSVQDSLEKTSGYSVNYAHH